MKTMDFRISQNRSFLIPREHDVIIGGKPGEFEKHPGNICFNSWVNSYKKAYYDAEDIKKRAIINDIIQKIRPGAFLQYTEEFFHFAVLTQPSIVVKHALEEPRPLDHICGTASHENIHHPGNRLYHKFAHESFFLYFHASRNDKIKMNNEMQAAIVSSGSCSVDLKTKKKEKNVRDMISQKARDYKNNFLREFNKKAVLTDLGQQYVQASEPEKNRLVFEVAQKVFYLTPHTQAIIPVAKEMIDKELKEKKARAPAQPPSFPPVLATPVPPPQQTALPLAAPSSMNLPPVINYRVQHASVDVPMTEDDETQTTLPMRTSNDWQAWGAATGQENQLYWCPQKRKLRKRIEEKVKENAKVIFRQELESMKTKPMDDTLVKPVKVEEATQEILTRMGEALDQTSAFLQGESQKSMPWQPRRLAKKQPESSGRPFTDSSTLTSQESMARNLLLEPTDMQAVKNMFAEKMDCESFKGENEGRSVAGHSLATFTVSDSLM